MLFNLFGSGMLIFLIALILVDFFEQKKVTKSELLGRIFVFTVAFLALWRT